MQPRVKAVVCPKCNGTGILKNKTKCSYCKGSGFIGTDGVIEYYLKKDGKSNLIVSDIKSNASSNTNKQSNVNTNSQRKSIIKNLGIILTIIIYALYLALHFLYIKNKELFSVMTIIFIGSIVLILLYNSRFSLFLKNLINRSIIHEPNDLIWYIKKKKFN